MPARSLGPPHPAARASSRQGAGSSGRRDLGGDDSKPRARSSSARLGWAATRFVIEVGDVGLQHGNHRVADRLVGSAGRRRLPRRPGSAPAGPDRVQKGVITSHGTHIERWARSTLGPRTVGTPRLSLSSLTASPGGCLLAQPGKGTMLGRPGRLPGSCPGPGRSPPRTIRPRRA